VVGVGTTVQPSFKAARLLSAGAKATDRPGLGSGLSAQAAGCRTDRRARRTPVERTGPDLYSGRMDTASAAASNMPGAVGRLSAGVRRALIAYARWLGSISWKRFFLLSVLALIASGILSALPPFNIEWGGERPAAIADKPAKAPPSKAQASGSGSAGLGGSYQISIDKKGVNITRAPAASAPAGAAGPAGAASADAPSSGGTAGIGPVPRMTPVPPGPLDKGIHIELPSNVDTDEVVRAIEEAQAEIAVAIREGEHPRPRRQRGFVLGEHLPPFTFLLIVLSIVTKIMAGGRFKAEAQAVVATEIAESEALKRQVVEARMAAMQAQVEPHFLFNTLASIDHLIETDPKRASQMQKNLIALLRASMPAMREAQPNAHNLGREMAVIRPYLEILKVRMEDRLQTDVAVPEGLLSAEFPPMMIQSLVENAIKHGLEPKPEGGRLTLRAEIVHGKLAVTVADTGLGFGKAATGGTGTGLANIRERLKLLYGSRASMTVTENVPQGTVVTLIVPYQAQTSEHHPA
jgi:two-component sensor histidine kinase